MKNFWIILSVAVVGIVAAFVIAGGDKSTSSGTIENPRVIQADDRVRGEGNKGVELIEYADFECPGCGAMYPLIKQLEAEFGDDIKIAFRHFPLVNIHPNAMAAHRAAEAAEKQGKFWEMHDLIYERQAAWSSRTTNFSQAVSIFETYAEELELNSEQYKADADSNEVFSVIDRHINSGNDLNFTGTPTFILNGEDISTPRSYEEFQTLIQDAIKAKEDETKQTKTDAPAVKNEDAATTPSEDTETTTEN